MYTVINIIVFILLNTELVLGQEPAQPNLSHQSHPGFSTVKPCTDNSNITGIFELLGLERGERNQYVLVVEKQFERFHLVVLMFDTEDANVTIIDETPATLISNPKNRQFHVIFTAPHDTMRLKVKGPPFGNIPYPTSIQVNSEEICKELLTGYFDYYVTGKDTIPDDSCGRRKVEDTELIVDGLLTKPGDWPWHAAVYNVQGSKMTYICGGTLLRDLFILTAAHCVTYNSIAVLPQTRKVILGKYNLLGADIAPQEFEVDEIIVHDEFNRLKLDNDLALIKLKTPAVFTNYVQPVCIWWTVAMKTPEENIHGTVVGWGYDKSDSLSSLLKQITIPKQTESTCIKSNPLFYSKKLNNQKFCAGFNNGTSACNGDSGGGFHVFVPDANTSTGAWYIRGIVSLSVRRTDAAICDPHQYTIFTDVAEYRGWLTLKMSQHS